ncbi:hypothetical protein MHU86_5112 [Fragilaria crotonensis]|nr:hypothetical protein MHU86_5112 [Fragilaria crotonensis]
MLSDDSHRRASNRQQEQGLIVEDELEQLQVGCSVQVLGSYVHAHWPFKRRKVDREKGKNMAFVKVHVVEYDSRGRELLESRVERRQKVYIDDEEFEGPFPQSIDVGDYWTT